jgi:hypothetical protein
MIAIYLHAPPLNYTFALIIGIMDQAEPPAFTLVSCLAYSSTLKTEAMCSSETVDLQWITRTYIPEILIF